MKIESNCKDTGSGSGGSTGGNCSAVEQPSLLKTLLVSDSNICSKARARDINSKLAKFFHFNAIPFNLVESDELADLVKALCPSYYSHGLPGRFWMSTAGVDIAFNDLHEEVEGHLQSCDALMANMDGWENEKKQQLKIVTETGKIAFLISSLNTF